MHACQGRYFLSRSRELRIRTAAFFLCRSQTEVTLCFCFLTRLAGTKKASKLASKAHGYWLSRTPHKIFCQRCAEFQSIGSKDKKIPSSEGLRP